MMAGRGALFIAVSLGACTIAPATGGSPSLPGGIAELPPPGFGTLLQSEVSLSLTSRDVRIMVTPLEESVTRVTAPDTYERLSAMARADRDAAPEGSVLFLVSIYSEQADVRFNPDELQIISQGLRLSPLAIAPVTPGWGQRRVRQRQTEMAVYAYSGDLDLESDLLLVYGFDQTAEWSGILARVQAERGRARARAGVGR
jgi:hypothetical protein